MAINLDNSGVTFNDSLTQNTAAIANGSNYISGNGNLFIAKSNNSIRFKRLAVQTTGYNEVTMTDDGQTIRITYTDTTPPPVCTTVVIGG